MNIGSTLYRVKAIFIEKDLQIGIAAFVEGWHEPKFDIEMYVDPEDYLRVMSENEPDASSLRGIVRSGRDSRQPRNK